MNKRPQIISYEQIDVLMGSDSMTFAIEIANCQRDADVAWCEQAKADVAREIFKDIEGMGKRGEPCLWVTGFHIRHVDWQSLKDKWLKGSNENKTA